MTYRSLTTGLAVTLAAFSPAIAQEPLRIGVITTLSGPAGYLGEDIRNGLQLAVDLEGGTLGGVPVELIVEDDGQGPGQGRQIAERYIQDEGIRLLTGIVFSNVAGAVVPDVVAEGAFYVSANAAPSNLAGASCHENYFVVPWQNDPLHESAGQNATDQGYETAFVLAANYQGGLDAIAGFKRYFGGDIVGEIYTQLDQTDFAAEMAQIRAANPDVVYQFHPGGQGIAFLRQYQQAGLSGQVPMILSEPSSDAVILNAVGDAAIGMQVSARWIEDFDNAANQTFVSEWQAAYGDRPITYYANQGYETGLAIGAALRIAGGIDDADAFREAMRQADFESTRGSFAFGPNHHPIQDWYAADVVAGPDGRPVLQTTGKIFEAHGDPYAAECSM